MMSSLSTPALKDGCWEAKPCLLQGSCVLWAPQGPHFKGLHPPPLAHHQAYAFLNDLLNTFHIWPSSSRIQVSFFSLVVFFVFSVFQRFSPVWKQQELAFGALRTNDLLAGSRVVSLQLYDSRWPLCPNLLWLSLLSQLILTSLGRWHLSVVWGLRRNLVSGKWGEEYFRLKECYKQRWEGWNYKTCYATHKSRMVWLRRNETERVVCNQSRRAQERLWALFRGM